MGHTDQDGLDFIARYARVFLVELDADAGCATALSTLGGDPDDVASDWNFLLAFHQRKQHEHFFTQFVGAGAWHKDAPAFHIGHVSRVQRVFILNGQRQHARARLRL
mgnify:CR=1 FL=1